MTTTAIPEPSKPSTWAPCPKCGLRHDPRASHAAPTVGTRSPSVRYPLDEALRDLDRALAVARTAGAPTEELLRRVANSLTGKLNGYRERALTAAMLDAIAPVLDADEADLKADERRRMGR